MVYLRITGGGYEALILWHAEASVMAQIIPALDASQLNNLLGSAAPLLFTLGRSG